MLKTNVKPAGIKLILWLVAAFVAINLLARFTPINLTSWMSDILTVGSILFVALEIGLMQAFKGKKKLDGIQWFGAVIVVLAALGLLLGFLGMNVAILSAAKGFIDAALLIFVVIEIFR